MRLVARLSADAGLDLPLRAVFQNPTPQALAKALGDVEAGREPALEPGMGQLPDGALALSWGQQRMWALDQLEGASASYNMPFAARLTGSLDANALNRALRALALRHEPLRTIILARDGAPTGWLLDADKLDHLLVVETLDGGLDEHDRDALVQDRLQAFAGRPFDLSAEPLCPCLVNSSRHIPPSALRAPRPCLFASTLDLAKCCWPDAVFRVAALPAPFVVFSPSS